MTEQPLNRQQIADELERVRKRSLGLTTAVLDEAELTAQHSPLMSPLVWDLAHVGNYEELWLLRAAAGIEPMRPEIDSIYDAFEHPRAERPTLPLLSPKESVAYLDLVRRKALDSLDTIRLDVSSGSTTRERLLDRGFVYGLVLQHEHQHDETMLATHQLRRGAPVLHDQAPPPPAAGVLPAEVLVEAGPFVMGTSDDPWAYDNERPAHTVELPSYFIDTVPVSNAAFLAFVEAGGYDDERLWTDGGWRWRCESGKRSPAFWMREGTQWLRRRFGVVEPLPLDEPVQHVCWFEADAYARWAGRRLPTEQEWEKAAQGADKTQANLGQVRHAPTPVGSFPDGASDYGVHQVLGDVWEWTSTDFTGHPGFCTFPYKEYSEVFFGHDYKVLKGGSWATDPLACRVTFRNWDYPIRRQIFAGFRTVRDV